MELDDADDLGDLKNHEELRFQMVMGELRFREVDDVDL
jgi:hypothetical protein